MEKLISITILKKLKLAYRNKTTGAKKELCASPRGDLSVTKISTRYALHGAYAVPRLPVLLFEGTFRSDNFG